MFLVYWNPNDKGRLYYGNVLTKNVTERSLYVDVQPQGHIVTKAPDYKNLHIQSIDMDHIAFACETETEIKTHFAEQFI